MKDGGSFHKHKNSTLIVITFTFFCFLFLSTKARALVYCVGCNSATAATCSGADPGNMAAAGCTATTLCDDGVNSVVCPNIDEALDCIDLNNDTNATIRVAQGMHTGPGSGNPIDNTATMAAQTINILGGWAASNCVSRTLNPTNTTVDPVNDRVFYISNTADFTLSITLEGLTITGGDPTSNICGPSPLDEDNGGGVCVDSLMGTGGVNFTSKSNIYDDNEANRGGGLAVVAGGMGTGNMNVTIMNDTFTNNLATQDGGGMLLAATGNSLNATIDNDTIGGDNAFPVDGNQGNQGGGIAIRGEGGSVDVSNQGNTITNNTAVDGFGGGGILIINKSGSTEPVTVSIEEDEITLNEAEGDRGGGISIEAESGTTVNASINKTEIGNNSADTFGGGIAIRGPGEVNLFPVVNNIIFKNIAFGAPGGGGVAAVTSTGDSDFDLKFVNNTIADNQAPNAGGQGGGILADNLSDGQID